MTNGRGGYGVFGVVLAGWLAVGASGRPPGLADVKDVRIWRQPDHTQVVVELSRPVAYRTHVLPEPARLYIDLDDTWIEAPEREPRGSVPEAVVRRVRGGQNTLTRARVVLELDSPERAFQLFHLEDPFRVVVRIPLPEATAEPPQVLPDPPPPRPARLARSAAPRVPRAKPRRPLREPAAVASVPVPPAPKPPRGLTPARAAPVAGPAAAAPPGAGFDVRPVRLVMLDAGHGGHDPGAIGVGGQREKDLVLPVAHALATRLEAAGLRVRLTRSGDRFVPLEERARMADRAGADLFVSLHANAAPNPESQGVETYFLDTRSDRQTARVAARENGVSIEELDSLEHILASLRLGYSERFAARLAEDVQASLVERLRKSYPDTRDLGTKRGPFRVLFTSEMPAILVELGFVSNRVEVARLRTEAFVAVAAEGIAEGILEYADRHARSLVARR